MQNNLFGVLRRTVLVTHLGRESVQRCSLNDVDREGVVRVHGRKATRDCSSEGSGLQGQLRTTLRRTKELLRRVGRIQNLYDTGTQRFDTWDVVGEDTHVTSRSRQVDLHYIGRGEKGLYGAGL